MDQHPVHESVLDWLFQVPGVESVTPTGSKSDGFFTCACWKDLFACQSVQLYLTSPQQTKGLNYKE